VAVLDEPAADQPGHLQLVFDDQDAHVGNIFSALGERKMRTPLLVLIGLSGGCSTVPARSEERE
jgi:hypothetical protein